MLKNQTEFGKNSRTLLDEYSSTGLQQMWRRKIKK